MGIAIFRNTRNGFWRGFAVAMPLAMSLATILTANHFILDGTIGPLVAFTGLAIAMRISSPSPQTATVPDTLVPDWKRMEAA